MPTGEWNGGAKGGAVLAVVPGGQKGEDKLWNQDAWRTPNTGGGAPQAAKGKGKRDSKGKSRGYRQSQVQMGDEKVEQTMAEQGPRIEEVPDEDQRFMQFRGNILRLAPEHVERVVVPCEGMMVTASDEITELGIKGAESSESVHDGKDLVLMGASEFLKQGESKGSWIQQWSLRRSRRFWRTNIRS